MQVRIAVFCMPEPGHLQMMRPVIAGLARGGAEIRVFSHRDFEPPVRQAGAAFSDLFAGYPLERADDTSTPVPCRYVSYAAEYAHEIARDVERFGASLVVMETFSLVGRVVAGMLGLPWVHVMAGHALVPALYLRRLASDPRVHVSPSCHRAVATLREQGILPAASPFSFVTSVSPFLNLCCEPPAFLDEEQRRAFEPLAFFGCLPSPGEREPSRDPGRKKIYISFGNIVWRYFRAEAVACLRTLSEYIGSRPDTEGVVGLANAAVDPSGLRGLTLVPNADQPAALREADVFVTHHGLNSTHEAIGHCVPMLSYPFFWDQPDLAAKCQEMGLAVPLGGTLRGPLREAEIAAALKELSRDADGRATRLRRARDDELDVIAARGGVLRRIRELASGRRN